MADKPRVFHLITRLIKGGALTKTVKTVEGLEEYDFSVGFGNSYDPDEVSRLESTGVETVRFRSMRHYNPISAPVAVLAVARYLRRNEFDIVHTHSTEAGIIGRFAAALADVPSVVHTVHGVPFAADRNAVLNRFVLGCERAAASMTDRIISNADAITEEYLSYGIGEAEQYTTVYSGIDLERFRSAAQADDLPGERPRVAMIGRLADGKGFELAIDAFASMGEHDFSVVFVGEGPLRRNLEARIRRQGLGETVFLLGYREDIPEILAASDILILPSFREGTPRVISEAMAAGLPVIATDIAGIPEQVVDGANGYLIPPGDADALTDRLLALIDSRLREELGEKGRIRAAQFSEEAMLRDLDRVYTEVLSDIA